MARGGEGHSRQPATRSEFLFPQRCVTPCSSQGCWTKRLRVAFSHQAARAQTTSEMDHPAAFQKHQVTWSRPRLHGLRMRRVRAGALRSLELQD